MANRQEAERDNISSISGECISNVIADCQSMCGTVRNYVEAMRDSSQLLDLLSVAGSNDIETTKAAAGRTVLYPNVRASLHSPT